MATVVEKEKRMKSKKIFLLKKMAKVVIILTAVVSLSIFLVKFSVKDKRNTDIKVKKFKIEETNTVAKTREVDRRSFLTKNYIDLWENKLPEKMKVANGINIENIRQMLNDIAEKNYILNLEINFSLPVYIFTNNKDINDKKVSRILNTEVLVNFDCLSEYAVYYFLKELEEKNDFAIDIIESLEIKKASNFDKAFIKALLNNDMKPLFRTTIKLQWYELAEEGKQ